MFITRLTATFLILNRDVPAHFASMKHWDFHLYGKVLVFLTGLLF